MTLVWTPTKNGGLIAKSRTSSRPHVITRARATAPWKRKGFGAWMYSWQGPDAGAGPYRLIQEATVIAQQNENDRLRDRGFARKPKARATARNSITNWQAEVRALVRWFLERMHRKRPPSSGGEDALRANIKRDVDELLEDETFVDQRDDDFGNGRTPREFVADWFCIDVRGIPELRDRQLHKTSSTSSSGSSKAPPEIPRNATVRAQWIRCSKGDCSSCNGTTVKMRKDGAHVGHGPYWYAAWKVSRRTRSKYIGRELPDVLIDQIANDDVRREQHAAMLQRQGVVLPPASSPSYATAAARRRGSPASSSSRPRAARAP